MKSKVGSKSQIINPEQIGPDGTEYTVWDDIRVPAQSARLNPVQTKPDFSTFVGGTQTFQFDPTSDETVHFSVQLPHNYKLGTDLKPHIHWSPNDTNTGSVVWKLEYTLANFEDTFPATSNLQVADPADGTALKHQIAPLGTIDGSGIDSLSTMIICALTRVATDGSDTYTNDAALLEIDFHYEIDTLGSSDEFTK